MMKYSKNYFEKIAKTQILLTDFAEWIDKEAEKLNMSVEEVQMLIKEALRD